jgi:hypothetical protein
VQELGPSKKLNSRCSQAVNFALGECPLLAGSCRSKPIGERLLWVRVIALIMENCHLLLRSGPKLAHKKLRWMTSSIILQIF